MQLFDAYVSAKSERCDAHPWIRMHFPTLFPFLWFHILWPKACISPLETHCNEFLDIDHSGSRLCDCDGLRMHFLFFFLMRQWTPYLYVWLLHSCWFAQILAWDLAFLIHFCPRVLWGFLSFAIWLATSRRALSRLDLPRMIFPRGIFPRGISTKKWQKWRNYKIFTVLSLFQKKTKNGIVHLTSRPRHSHAHVSPHRQRRVDACTRGKWQTSHVQTPGSFDPVQTQINKERALDRYKQETYEARSVENVSRQVQDVLDRQPL